MLKIDIIK